MKLKLTYLASVCIFLSLLQFQLAPLALAKNLLLGRKYKSKRLYALRILKRSGVPPADLRIVYCSFIRPILEYACPAWHSSLPQKLRDQVEQVQRRATKVILPSLSYSERLVELDLVTLNERRESLTRRFYSSVLDSSSRIHDILPARVEHKYCLRRPRALPLVKCNTKRLQNSFLPYAIKNWDDIIVYIVYNVF